MINRDIRDDLTGRAYFDLITKVSSFMRTFGIQVLSTGKYLRSIISSLYVRFLRVPKGVVTFFLLF